jgi:sugar lactone lactonase YvrE
MPFRIFKFSFIWLVLIGLVLSTVPARATITVLDAWQIGEGDPGAAASGAATNLVDHVGTFNLKTAGAAVYSSDVATAAAAHAGSLLSVNFTNSTYASSGLLTTVADNFGVELWVKPTATAGNDCILYNGNSGGSGWGLFIINGTYQIVFGGRGYVGSGTVTMGGWTHLALVRNNGVTTLYTNGVIAGASSSLAPNTPAGSFALATTPTAPGAQVFTGLMDEARFFTFSAGQFSTNDLLCNAPPEVLGATNLLMGPSAGSNSVSLVIGLSGSIWSASPNATWLHLSPANQNGTGSTNMIFSYDANPGATRSGTLTIGGQTVTVTQAGSTFVTAGALAPLITLGFSQPTGVAVDGSGNVYIADTTNNVIEEWMATNNSLITLVSTGLAHPQGAALDAAGNVYIADSGNNAVKKQPAGGGAVSTLISSGLADPNGLAVDGAGNLYLADTVDAAIKEWTSSNHIVTTLVSTGLSNPEAVALDAAGNVYFSDTGNNAIKRWNAVGGVVNTLVSSGLNSPGGVAVDGSGNIYFADTANNAFKELAATSGTVITLASGLNGPLGVAVDGAGNLYVANSGLGTIEELPHIFISAPTNAESVLAGSDSVTVLPTTANLAGLFAPASDASWLTINGVTNGVVAFSFSDNNTGASRTGHIRLLGQTNAITQSGPLDTLTTNALMEPFTAGTDSVGLTVAPAGFAWFASVNVSWLHLRPANQGGAGNATVTFTFDANPSGTNRTGTLTIGSQTLTVTQGSIVLGLANIVEGPAAGNDSVTLGVSPANSAWTATANVTWLHLSSANQNGAGGTNLFFTYDTNPGATRTGTLTIGTDTLMITQAGSTYVAAGSLTTLASGLANAYGLAVDGAGNVYSADNTANRVQKWVMTNNTLTTLISTGLSGPDDVAVDGVGNVYIADTGNNALKEWVAASNAVITLASGLSGPQGVAVDGTGNVYIADTGNGILKQWVAASDTVISLLNLGVPPICVAVDAPGNLYFGENSYYIVVKWLAADGVMTTLMPDGTLAFPQAVAVDGAGSVDAADSEAGKIKQWSVTSQAVTTPISGLHNPAGVAVDGQRNIYVSSSSLIAELPRAFVDPTPRKEGAATGGDTLPVILPTTENLLAPFKPASDASWLTIPSVTNGAVTFAFTANTGNARVGHILLLGQTITITQNGTYTLATNALLEPFTAGTDSVSLLVYPATATWTASTNATWLHLSSANQRGTGSATVTFTFDVNLGLTNRTGTMTIGGQTLTITQAGVTATPPLLIGLRIASNGGLQFSFSNYAAVSFSVWSTTNMALPDYDWTYVGAVTNVGGGLFKFGAPPDTTNAQRYYEVVSP